MAGILARLASVWRFRRAETALTHGRFREAAGLFGDVLSLTDSPSARVKRGLALWETGARTEGIAHAEEGAGKLPDHNPTRLFLALLYCEEGRFEEGEKIIEAVRARDPENLFAGGIEALRLLAAGKEREAAGILERGVFASPLFRAHLLLAVEKSLKRRLSPAGWNEAYLEMVL